MKIDINFGMIFSQLKPGDVFYVIDMSEEWDRGPYMKCSNLANIVNLSTGYCFKAKENVPVQILDVKLASR